MLACLAAAAAGALTALIFAFLVLGMQASQVATGLALTIFGIGLSALAGQNMVGIAYAGLPRLDVPGLTDLPIIGPLLFSHDALVYASWLLPFAVAYFLYRTRGGLILRAVGDSHDAAHAIGYAVIAIRYLATLFGVRHMAARARVPRRLPVRRHHHPAAACPGLRHPRRLPVHDHAALPGDDPGAGADIPGSHAHTAERPGLHRQAVPSARVIH